MIKQFQFGIGRKIESNIVWQKLQCTTAFTQLNIYACLTSRKENCENILSPALNKGRQRQKPCLNRVREGLFSRAGDAFWNPPVKANHWLCQHMHGHRHRHGHARTHCWKIKCWTGDWEQNRHFLSPFSFEFTWREQVGEVKQIFPGLSEVPQRGVGLHVGGTMQTSFWQLLSPLTSYLEQTIVWDPHRGRRYVEFTFWMLKNWSCSSLLIAHMRHLWNVEHSRVWEGGPTIFTPCQGEIHWFKKKTTKKNLRDCEQSLRNKTKFFRSIIFIWLFTRLRSTRTFFSINKKKKLSSPSLPVYICYKSWFTLRNMTFQMLSA